MWHENFRHGELKNDTAIINWFVTKSPDKMYALAKDVLENGILDPLIVVSNDDKYHVYDGNRRLSTIKLLLSPNLSIDNTTRDRFQKLKESYPNDIDKISDNIPILVYEENVAMRLISRRHKGEDEGRGTMPWSPEAQETGRRKSGEKEKYPRVGFINRYLQSAQGLDIVKESITENYTTWDRILNFMNDWLIVKDGETTCILSEENLDNSLLSIQAKIQSEKLTSRTSKEEFQIQMDNMFDGFKKLVPWSLPVQTSSEIKSVGKKRTKKTMERSNLIPTDFEYPPKTVSHVTQGFFTELRHRSHIKVDDCPFTTAAALRAFMESLFYDATNKTSLSDSFKTLLKSYKENHPGVKEKDYANILGERNVINTIHSGAHGVNLYRLNAKELRLLWDNLGELIRFSYKKIKEKSGQTKN